MTTNSRAEAGTTPDSSTRSGESGVSPQSPVYEVRFGGLTTICHSSSMARDSAALLEHILEPHFLAAPMHRHRYEDEISHVLEGRLAVLQGGTVRVAGKGETIVKPRGVMHTFWNPDDVPVRFMEVVAPGTGFERYLEEIAPIIGDGSNPDIPGLMAVAERYGLELDIGSLPDLLQTHGLRM
jgi:mannose-6-phosphate isomerase-like protein (cupin superfamily)